MSLNLTNENKNTLNLENEEKDDSMTWDESNPSTWNEAKGPWDAPRRPLTKESKNTLTLNNESKN